VGLEEPREADSAQGLIARLIAGLAGLQLNTIKGVAQIYRIPEDSVKTISPGCWKEFVGTKKLPPA
jgi:hypothetical protein